jgi:hypothetical protein
MRRLFLVLGPTTLSQISVDSATVGSWKWISIRSWNPTRLEGIALQGPTDLQATSIENYFQLIISTLLNGANVRFKLEVLSSNHLCKSNTLSCSFLFCGDPRIRRCCHYRSWVVRTHSGERPPCGWKVSASLGGSRSGWRESSQSSTEEWWSH